MNQDVVLAIALPVTLFLIMFSMGTSLVLADFKRVLETPSAILVGMISQMVLLPCLAFLLLFPMKLPAEIFIGFMILAFSPGGTTSNMFAFLAGGCLALSISLTAIISVITPFTIPLLAGWVISMQLDSSAAIQLPFLQTLAKLVLVTLIPVVLGMLLRHFRSGFCQCYKHWLTRIPLAMLLLVIIGIIVQNWENMPYFIEQTGVAALLLASLALLLGYGFARVLRHDMQVAKTIAIETSIQNGGTAILVTGTILQNPAMTIAPVMYGILMLLPVLSYLAWLKLSRARVVA